ncbi:hypothetical protein CEP52_016878 [Fusarium oligoseptatum]|uniref:Uncharacterized protein n=1 Tax=Fusarium oligoseptatum TaxID=2604345 RepID=A0A428RYZ1_9HYPO|nr:hypothetical protein CEP52_016878 [Fusarium oligoseptatum]
MGKRNSHHISSDEVLNAPGLASKGEQRLRTIVDGEPNHFSFRIAFEDEQWALVEFHILPVASEFAQHPLYAVTGSFTPSHDAVHPSRVLVTAQLVYDTYIRVTWLKLSEDFLERRAPVSSSTSHNRGNSEMCRDGSGGRELRRKGRKHRPSNGARLANQIVNHLLVTDGVAAMGVYDGLAEHCYKISKAAEATPEDAEYITMNVAAKLHGKVLAPPDSSQVPLPAVWLKSILTKVPYHIICHDIGLPNLAALSLEPQWSTLDGRLVMPLGAPMSLIRKKWSIWVSADPTIQAFRGQLESNVSGMSMASSPNVPHLPGRQHGPIFQSDDLACNGTSPREFTRPNSRGNVGQNDNMTGILAPDFGTDWNSQQCLSDLDRVLSDFTMHCDAGFIGFPSA